MAVAQRISDREYENLVLSGKTDWTTNHWYHLTGTYDGSQMRLFVDGVEDKNSPRPQTGSIDSAPSDCGIGSCDGQHLFYGIVDEVRVYDRAVSADEVRTSHHSGRESIRAEQDLVFQPEPVGEGTLPFRKPPREITEIEEGFLWIDAEDFTDYGGWWLDTQFVHLMGSAYLIAAGVGTPVEDATVDLDVPRSGRYRLWVRAKNWLRDHSPGGFQVLVNGRPSEKTLEAWQRGVLLDGELTAPARVNVVQSFKDSTLLRVVMYEGRKRQIRRVGALLGHPVQDLRRIRLGPLQLRDLDVGQWRYLTSKEIQKLESLKGRVRKRKGRRPGRRRKRR